MGFQAEVIIQDLRTPAQALTYCTYGLPNLSADVGRTFGMPYVTQDFRRDPIDLLLTRLQKIALFENNFRA